MQGHKSSGVGLRDAHARMPGRALAKACASLGGANERLTGACMSARGGRQCPRKCASPAHLVEGLKSGQQRLQGLVPPRLVAAWQWGGAGTPGGWVSAGKWGGETPLSWTQPHTCPWIPIALGPRCP